MCAKAVDPAFAPFCSGRCRLLDLGDWLSDVRALPVVDDDERLDDASEGS